VSDLTFEHERDRFEDALKKLSVVIDGLVAQQCAHHYEALTQEHQFTSGLARVIEMELERFPIEGLNIQVHSREFPDRGPGSLEKPTGADLYISIVRLDTDIPISKGMLIQAKWDSSLRRPDERRKLRQQVDQMMHRSRTASYVWVYEQGGATVTAARSLRRKLPARLPSSMTVGELIAAGVRCNEGDYPIGRNTVLPPILSLNAIMRQVAASAALDFIVDLRGD
jgi:hypothetical protein